MLGHGAGGSVTAPDLVAVTNAATADGVQVVLVEQPYRVAGKRSTPTTARLDEAWLSVLGQLPLDGLPHVSGGRSSGARVACRTAEATGAVGVLCLAFPLVPPQRREHAPTRTRLPELEEVRVPLLVVQGESDRFGMPEPAPGREVVVVAGDHGLKKDHARVTEAVTGFLRRVLP